MTDWLKQGNMMPTLRPYQKEAVDASLRFFENYRAPGVVVAPTGCHAKGYILPMYGGGVKKVEKIKVGDKLIGPDGKPREVMKLHRKRGFMCYVVTGNGSTIKVNLGHIFPLINEDLMVVKEFTVGEWLTFRPEEKAKWGIWNINQAEPVRFSVEYYGEEERYYGFELDGGHLYVDTKGFVHHNSGKSMIIGSVVKGLGKKTLVLQPSKEILKQNFEKAEMFGMEPKMFSASMRIKEIGDITYATLKSIKKNVKELREIGVDTIIVDECHAGYPADKKSEFMKFVKDMGNVKVLGMTATPCRLHSYSSLMDGNFSTLNMLMGDDPRFFCEMVHIVQIPEIVKQGYWAKIDYEVWNFDESRLVLNSSGAEYTLESVKESIEKNGINNAIYLRILKLMKERKHILACMDSVDTCKIISDFMNKKFGRISDCVTSLTKQRDRDRIVEEFKAGELKVVFNYSTLNTGFDFPELDCVLMGRPTLSFSTYYQTVGRGVRPHKDKKSALFVDCCNNYRRFGGVENVTIEKFPGRGWCIFSGNKLVTGVNLNATVTREELMERLNKGVSGRRRSSMDTRIMSMGKHQGKQFKDVPLNYWRWLIDTLPQASQMRQTAFMYYREITS